MKFCRVFTGFLIYFLSFNIVCGNDFSSGEFKIFQNVKDEHILEDFVADGVIDKIWGVINSDSVRVSGPITFIKNSSSEATAWNVTITSRIMDGIRLRSLNNTGANGDIIKGGIGYDFVTLMLVGLTNEFYFLFDAYENYASSLIPNPPPVIPDIVFQEWGVINYASKKSGYVFRSDFNTSEVTGSIEASKPFDGIRLTSHDRSVASAEIIKGGIGYNYFTYKIVGIKDFVDFSFNTFENGTYLETRERVYGNIDKEVKLLDEQRFQNYPQIGANASGNASFSTSGTILGIKLTFLNYTDGLYEIIKGGLNESFVTYEFNGPYQGEPYDFKIEIFGNNAATVKFSIILMIILNILIAVNLNE
ncbi:unnamed protein product [Chironomus riparius]|uniref:Uncharacterized protein n=1 Tax=Chironomus riparius TaxID=315576 RepID=A0A9N9WM85_9DIPT|nr:unnamed protein product [Chironomus riparius]